jgi:hypothetical protein
METQVETIHVAISKTLSPRERLAGRLARLSFAIVCPEP